VEERESLLDAPTIAAPAETSPSLAIDEPLPTINGYEILRELGRGGMGVVYLARQLTLDRLVALKTIQPRDDEKFAELLLSEAQIVGKLNHPAIVPIHEANTNGPIWFFSMGLVSGDDLAHRLAKGVLNAQQVVELASTLCDALEHAHRQNILHLDIKPANILLDSSGAPKLTDFGLSAIHASASMDRQIVGTPQFMSPEQALGAASDFSPASDIYALGAVMYAALVGRPPIVSANPQDLILKVISQPPTPLRQFGLRVPRPLEAIILKCLQKKPAQRYLSAAELKKDLEAFARGQPVRARPPSLWASLEYQLRRHVLAASVSGSAALVLLLLVGVIFARSWSQRSQIDELLTDNDRLRQLVSLQHELMRGRMDQDAVAVQLAESGDFDRAAFFAAQAIQSGRLEGTEVMPALAKIVEDYAKRHPPKSGIDESQEEMIERVLNEIDALEATKLNEVRDAKSPSTANNRELSDENGAKK